MGDPAAKPPGILHIRIDPDLRERLDRFCRGTHRSVNNGVTVAVEDFLNRWERDQP